MDNNNFKHYNGVKKRIPMYAKVLLSFLIVILNIVTFIIYNLFFYHKVEIAKMEKKYNQALISNYEKNIDAFELLRNVFLENDTISLTPSEDGYIIWSKESNVKYEDHAICSKEVTDALNRIMAESKIYPSFNGENEIKCTEIYGENDTDRIRYEEQRKDAEQNKYVMFTFNTDSYVYLIYSETGKSWDPYYPCYEKKEIRINENWYLLYARPRLPFP